MKTAVVLGASGGIGRAIATQLVATDTKVVSVVRDEARAPSGTQVLVADLSVAADVSALALAIAREVGPIDWLVVATGKMVCTPLEAADAAQWQHAWGDNVAPIAAALGPLHLTLAPGAHRVILGAYVEKLAFPKLGLYAATKAAVDALARVALKEQRAWPTAYLRLPAVDTPLWKTAPFALPAGALSPAAVAERIVQCLTEGTHGVVDL
jgi:3-oxoacyl-[acyl-carrier protein] reductase